jgi:tetratricopeptide (TPR) repeat protein
MLSMIYRGEYAQGYNAEPDPLGRALAAAQRAMEIAPANHLAYFAQATTLFFQKEKLHFRVAAERAIALNPLDGCTVAFLGMLMAFTGDWERGCKLVESAMQLNSLRPGWLYVSLFINAYRQCKYGEALAAALRTNAPGYFHLHAYRAAALGQMGEHSTAQKALKDLLALRPDFDSVARHEYEKWFDPELVEHLLDGLRKAGLEIADEPSSPVAKPATRV